MSLSQIIVSALWWGPFRRPFEAIVRRAVGRRSKIVAGPLRGYAFAGGLAYRLGIYELHVQQALMACLHEGDVFYDVGANNGYFTLLGARRVGSAGHVYAFEPFPLNAATVQQVLTNNLLSNSMLVPMALANVSGRMDLYFASNADTATPTLTPSAGNQTVTVETTTLDEFVGRHRQPNFIKLDVEGAEALVLKGASQTLSSPSAPIWIIEVHSSDSADAVRSILASHRHHIRDLTSPRHRPSRYPLHVLAWKQ